MKTRMIVKSLAVVGIITLLLAAVATVTAQTVNFPDPNLEAVVREALPKPTGPISTDDMLTLTNLTANGRDIHDLTGLETALNLRDLQVEWNPITNHTAISALTNLVILSVSANGTPDIGFVAPLKQLQNLNLYSNGIQDISPLAGLVDLQALFMPWNPATNFATLSALTNLVELDIGHSGTTNLDFIAPLQKLQRLSLDSDGVPDISTLAGRTNLLSLNLNWNGVTNPAVLATLTGLQELHLTGNNLTNVPYLASLTNLTGLDLPYTGLADMSPVTNLTRLVWLNVGENSLTSLPDLSPLACLLTFMMAGNQITDLSPIIRLPVVSQLHLQRNPFQDLSPLTNCPYLYILLFYDNNAITNLPVLGAIPNLEVLQLEAMQITNLSQIDFLATLPGLGQLDLYQNHITDLSPLTNYTSLNWLGVEANRLQRIEPLLDMPALGYVNLRNNYLDTNATSAAWNVITNLQGRGVTVEFDPQLDVPILPHILGQPANRSGFLGDTAVFIVSVEKNGPAPEFRWQKDGVDLENDSRISGADNDTLAIAGLIAEDTGHYSVRVWRDWAVTNSTTAGLLVVTNVVFADPNLEAAVRDQLGILRGELTTADLATLISLDAGGRNITNLSGLEAAVNLEWLRLADNRGIQSFEPLTYLPVLKVLFVDGCGLSDLGGIACLTRLGELGIGNNIIQDIAPLRSLSELYYLWADRNHFAVIDPLLDLPALSVVNVEQNHLDTNATSAAWNVITNLVDRGVIVDFDPQYFPLAVPVITTQPASRVAFPGDNISFLVEATGSGSGLSHLWQKNGLNLQDGPRIFNTGGNELFIDAVDATDAGSYRVQVWDEFGLTNSLTATLRVVTNVAFVDPNLERAVRNRLGIPTDPLTPADLAPMTWLDAYNYGITNLSGLESAANLDWLSLDSNPGITDFAPLLQLPRLAFLNLNSCAVSNLAFVAALSPLNELHVWGGTFTDISSLAAQPQLLRLNLGNNHGITNLTVLDSLTRIEGLFIDSMGLTNLDFVPNMPQLAELNVWDNAVQDLTPLTAVTNLLNLNLGYNRLTNVTLLAGCTNLETLGLGANQITDLSFVTSLPRLWYLNVSDNPIPDLSPLTGRTNLTQLNIGLTLATNLAPVATLMHLTDLHVWQLGLTDNLGFLVPLTSLQVLDLGNNGITNLPAYPSLNRLRYLNLSGNPLASLATIVTRTNLNELYINNTGVSDLSSLAGHTNFNNLGLADNGVTDISPLATLAYLRWITLWNNNVQDISALSGLTDLDYLDLRYNLLNVAPGSPAMTVIQTLQGGGATVDYLEQKVWLASPARVGGLFQFTVQSTPDTILEIWSSTTLINWTLLGSVTNTTGAATFTDSSTPTDQKFYRAQQQ